MTAEEAIAWIESARYSAVKVGLDNMRALLKKLGNPERKVKCAHVAGTNGKGSVCALMESVLRSAGYKTGLYTSPYLMRYNERIRLMNEPIDDEALARCAEKVRRAAEEMYGDGVKPTAFELGTAVAFCAFAEAGVEVAVIETGLGGRLDPTNVISPEVCAIASIGMDHTAILGDTLELIAGEKAGILKPYTPCAVYPAGEGVMSVITAKALSLNAPLYAADNYEFIDLERGPGGSSFGVNLPVFGLTRVEVKLPGRHQEQNARLAMLALSLMAQKGFSMTRDEVVRGIAAARWPGRLEWFAEGVLLDGAHNVDGALALADYLDTYLKDRSVILLTGMMSDKRPREYAQIIAPRVLRVVTTRVNWDRAVEAYDLAAIYESFGVESTSVEGIESALSFAMKKKGADDVLLVAGSLYLVGAVRKLLCG